MATISLLQPEKTAQPRQKYFKDANSIGAFLLCAILLVATLISVWLSRGWPLALDAPILQYAAFLMSHGKVPYKDIIEMNTLGATLSSWLEMHLFGYSDFGWRLYDLLLVLAGSLGIVLICKPFKATAAIIGACLFALLHFHLGIREVGERDFQMAAFELLGAGLLLQGFRARHWGWFLASGIMSAIGATIKPTAVFFIAVFLLQAIVINMQRRKSSEENWAEVWLFATGVMVPCVAAVFYLLVKGALGAFLAMLFKFLPLYSRMGHRTSSILWPVVRSHLEYLLVLLAASGLLLVCKPKAWLTRESILVLLSVMCGFFSYWVQAKAFSHQLDPFMAFLAVWCGLAVGVLLQERRTLILLPLALALAYWTVTWVPAFVRHTGISRYDLTPVHQLEAGISKLRAEGKDKGIQVMDTSNGALHALYDLKLVQSTGFLYDFYFYQFPDDPYIQGLRTRFLKEMETSRPDLLVISDQVWPPDSELSYRRIDEWPDFRNLLGADYKLGAEPPGYRIYVRR